MKNANLTLDWHFPLVISNPDYFKLSFSEITDNIRKAIIASLQIKKLNKLFIE